MDNLTTNVANKAQNPAFLVGAVIGSASLTEAQIEHQIEMDKAECCCDYVDDDYECFGYECIGCGNLQENDTGFGCDECMGHSLEPWYG